MFDEQDSRTRVTVVDGTSLKERLAAILAADVAGYSRLMAFDDRATVAALDAARRVFRAHVESNHGRVIDMAGDSVLAVFETAAGAVAAAIVVQQDLSVSHDVPLDRRMRFRIGVHLGDLIEKCTSRPCSSRVAASRSPANERGTVNLDSLTERARQNYLYAHTLIGRASACPVVRSLTLH
jgi:hypothetical protein